VLKYTSVKYFDPYCRSDTGIIGQLEHLRLARLTEVSKKFGSLKPNANLANLANLLLRDKIRY